MTETLPAEFRSSGRPVLLRLLLALSAWALVGAAWARLFDHRPWMGGVFIGLSVVLSCARILLGWSRSPRVVRFEPEALTIRPRRGADRRVRWSDLEKASRLPVDDDAWRFRLADEDVLLPKHGFTLTDWRALEDHVREACFRNGVPYSYVD